MKRSIRKSPTTSCPTVRFIFFAALRAACFSSLLTLESKIIAISLPCFDLEKSLESLELKRNEFPRTCNREINGCKFPQGFQHLVEGKEIRCRCRDIAAGQEETLSTTVIDFQATRTTQEHHPGHSHQKISSSTYHFSGWFTF